MIKITKHRIKPTTVYMIRCPECHYTLEFVKTDLDVDEMIGETIFTRYSMLCPSCKERIVIEPDNCIRKETTKKYAVACKDCNCEFDCEREDFKDAGITYVNNKNKEVRKYYINCPECQKKIIVDLNECTKEENNNAN